MVFLGLSEVYGFWKMYWIRRTESLGLSRNLGGSRAPWKVISPVQLLCRPTRQRASVVLPEPDSPTRATHHSCGTTRSTPESTGVRPYRAEMARNDRAGNPPSVVGAATAASRSAAADRISAARMQRTSRLSMRTGGGGILRQSL